MKSRAILNINTATYLFILLFYTLHVLLCSLELLTLRIYKHTPNNNIDLLKHRPSTHNSQSDYTEYDKVYCLAHGIAWIILFCFISRISWYNVVGPLELELGQKDENDHHDETHSGSKSKYLHGL